MQSVLLRVELANMHWLEAQHVPNVQLARAALTQLLAQYLVEVVIILLLGVHLVPNALRGQAA